MNFAPKECYREAFYYASDGKSYKCMGLTNDLGDGRYTFVQDKTYTRGYIERVASEVWVTHPELPDDLVCRELVKSTHSFSYHHLSNR